MSNASSQNSNDSTSPGSSNGGASDVSVTPEIVDGRAFPAESQDDPYGVPENIVEPAKVMRIGSMVKQLLEEVRGTPLDEKSRERLAEIYERSIVEISSALSNDLAQELHELALPFKDGDVPSEGELRVAKAQLVGWLEGLFHGIQATLFAQQFAARQQLEQMRQIPPQNTGMGERPGGTYL